jgi:hypothetical protein
VSGPTKRPYLLLRDGKPVSASIVDSSSQEIFITWPDGSRTLVKGVNRRAGYVRGCGVGDLPPAKEPVHDATCRVPDDLVAVTTGAGLAADSGGAANFTLHPDGRIDLVPAGAEGEIELSATGRMIGLLREKMKKGLRARLDLGYAALTGQSRQEGIYAVNGAPILLRNGEPVRDEDQEGWATDSVSRDRADFVHHWVTERNPRTAVGVGADGTIWFLVVDGHEKANDGQGEMAIEENKSAGMSIEELRAVMRFLGAKDALNLDGGGSSALIVDGKLVSHPSDATGERQIGDAIVLTPRN